MIFPVEILKPQVKKKLITKTPTEWTLEFLVKMRSTLQYLLPLLLEMEVLCLSIPVSSAWPERGASCVKRIKTRLRSTIKNDMLESLLHIAINGPEPKDTTALIDSTLKDWLAKPRRNMSSVKQQRRQEESTHQIDVSKSVGSAVDGHDEEIENASYSSNEQIDLQEEESVIMMFNDEADEVAATLLKLPAVEQDEYFTDSHSDFEDSTTSS